MVMSHHVDGTAMTHGHRGNNVLLLGWCTIYKQTVLVFPWMLVMLLGMATPAFLCQNRLGLSILALLHLHQCVVSVALPGQA